MSIVQIKELTNSQIESICNKVDGCAECPLLISSYKKHICCLRDEVVKMYDVEETYELMQRYVNLDECKIVGKE